MLHAAARGQPLHIAFAVTGGGAQRVSMVHQPLAHNGHGLEAAMGMGRKARHLIAVVHAEAILAAEIHADLPTLQQRGIGPKLTIAARVMILVVGTKNKRINTGQASLQGLRTENDGGVVVRHAISFIRDSYSIVSVDLCIPSLLRRSAPFFHGCALSE